jgi:nitrite reductase (NO-forming)
MAHTITDRSTGSGQDPDDFPPHPRAQVDELLQREHRLEDRVARRDTTTLVVYLVAAVSLILAAVAVGFGSRAVDEAKSSGGGAKVASGAGPATATVHLTEFAIEPKEITVGTGATLEIMNMGTMQHDLAVKGTSLVSKRLDAGASDKLVLTGLAPGDYTVICTVPGHEQAGMTAVLHVGSGGASSTAAASSTASATATSTGAKIDPNATPGPNWHAFDPTLKPADGATVHDVAFHMKEVVAEVSPGVTQQLWTFEGQVPGPTLHGHVGDVFNVTLTNDGTIGHSIDFHASEVAPNIQMRTIQPGESLVYQFKAQFAGIWMYHCGTAPILHHIGNGMFGAVVIDPPNLPAVDHEYLMVQSELYLGPQGQAGDLTKMQDEKFDAVVFNGYTSQYKFSPIRVEPGERVRVWLLDAGPNENSSFHIVGTIFDTIFKEGKYALRPDATRGGSQALDLQPAQGGFVEFTLDQPGLYPMVTHKFANVGKGALGLFQAGDVTGTMSH